MNKLTIFKYSHTAQIESIISREIRAYTRVLSNGNLAYTKVEYLPPITQKVLQYHTTIDDLLGYT